MVAGAPPDWQLGFAKAEQRLGYLLTYELWSDCIFVVGLETNPEIRAHKLVLAMASPIFEAMFFGLMQRIGQRIYIPDVQPEVFRALLQYIYTGDVDIGSLDKAYDLLDCAKKYKLPHLENKCNDYICTVGGSRNSGGDAARAGSNIVRSTRPHAPPALDKEIQEAKAQTDINEKSRSEPRSKEQSTSGSDKASSAPPMSAPYQKSSKTASMDSPYTLQPQQQKEQNLKPGTEENNINALKCGNPSQVQVEDGRIVKPRPKPSTESHDIAVSKLATPAEIVCGLLSSEREILEDAARAARRVTCASAEGTERITQLVVAGGIPPLVHALHHPCAGVQYDAAWAVTNIACVCEHAKALVDAGAVPALVGLLRPGGAVSEQAAWALGNIACLEDTARAAVLKAGAPAALLAHMLPSTPPAPLATYVRTYRILCQYEHGVQSWKWPRSRFKQLSPAEPYIENLLDLADEQVLTECCWVLYHLAGGAELTRQVLTGTLAARLSALLRPAAAAPGVQAAALAALGSTLSHGRLEWERRALEAKEQYAKDLEAYNAKSKGATQRR